MAAVSVGVSSTVDILALPNARFSDGCSLGLKLEIMDLLVNGNRYGSPGLLLGFSSRLGGSGAPYDNLEP